MTGASLVPLGPNVCTIQIDKKHLKQCFCKYMDLNELNKQTTRSVFNVFSGGCTRGTLYIFVSFIYLVTVHIYKATAHQTTMRTIYIYIQREREREREKSYIYTYIYIHIYLFVCYLLVHFLDIYIYIYENCIYNYMNMEIYKYTNSKKQKPNASAAKTNMVCCFSSCSLGLKQSPNDSF